VPETDEARTALPHDAPLTLERLPVLFGRQSSFSPAAPDDEEMILLEDHRPYHLSRRHFRLAPSPRGVVFEDAGSRLGSRVNGVMIGGRGATVSAVVLPLGKSRVMLGGNDTRLFFSLLVEPF